MFPRMLHELFRNELLKGRKGQSLVEYALIIAGVTLICAAALAIFGHKVADLLGVVAAILPCACDDGEENGPINSGTLLETTTDPDTGGQTLDTATMAGGGTRFQNNTGIESGVLLAE